MQGSTDWAEAQRHRQDPQCTRLQDIVVGLPISVVGRGNVIKMLEPRPARKFSHTANVRLSDLVIMKKRILLLCKSSFTTEFFEGF
jgi:hypothetical protein